jgi:hypothetical protein
MDGERVPQDAFSADDIYSLQIVFFLSHVSQWHSSVIRALGIKNIYMENKTKIFISYASEDRDDFVRPLAESLRDRFNIWYDKYSLVMGDSLRGKIDEGLSQCEFGIVILSKHFFSKRWPQMELDGLISRESSGRKVVLPIWHKIDKKT